jgi:dihydrofolate synthase/folylpolyglutamate synthase
VEFCDIVRYLEQQTIFNDLEKIKHMLSLLDLKIDPAKVIVVSGTNGKGTTCATLQTLLIAAKQNIGFFSSPHLIKINERIKFNNEDISDEDFCKVFHAVHAKIQNFDSSYFEYLTLMAAYYFFAVKNVDFAIFEVGLGGTKDASNAIPHSFCAITSLAMDHEDILGNDIIEIAANKFGIIGRNNKVFHTNFINEKVAALASTVAKENSAPLICAYPYDCEVEMTEKYPNFFIRNQWGKFKINLPGERAVENTSLALTIFDNLIENSEQFIQALENVVWPCRMEKLFHKNRQIFLSGDHNPHGIQSLLNLLEYYDYENIHFIVGICYDKNHGEMLQKLKNFRNSHLYLTETPVKTLAVENYDEIFRKSACFASQNPFEAVEAAVLKSNPNDLIIATGSLYLVGMIKKYIEN